MVLCYNNENYFSLMQKRSSLSQRRRCSCKFKNLRIGSRNICENVPKITQYCHNIGTFYDFNNLKNLTMHLQQRLLIWHIITYHNLFLIDTSFLFFAQMEKIPHLVTLISVTTEKRKWGETRDTKNTSKRLQKTTNTWSLRDDIFIFSPKK
jgi:TM2 domain-containing membrane protein YozV